jgi:D-inositol-3-phosphate glycosyltransferase
VTGSSPPTMVGLVRAIDPSGWRHRYAIGVEPDGELLGELGALSTTDEDRAVPIWVSAEGRVVTSSYPASASRPPFRVRMRWILAPLAWRRSAKLRARLGLARRRRRFASNIDWERTSESSEDLGPPMAFIYEKRRPGRRPLFSTIHPATGDQLVTTSLDEAARLGYGDAVRLGYVVAAAPVTRLLGIVPRSLPWASRAGFTAAESGPARAAGAVNRPSGGDPVPRDALRLSGWAVLESEPVARVEVLVDGHRIGRARLGLPRGAIDSFNAPEAPVSGFDYPFRPSELPDRRADRIRLEALVTGAQGTKFVVGPKRLVDLAPPLGGSAEGVEARLRRTRDRLDEVVRSRSGARTDGPLRLVAFTHRLTAGGAQRYLYEQMLRLNGEDTSWRLFASEGGPWQDRFAEIGIDVEIIGDYPTRDPDQYEERLASLAESVVSGGGVDLVFANTFDTFIAVDLADRLGVPSVWTIHESFEPSVWWRLVQGDKPEPYVRERSLHALDRASALLFVADATKRLYEKHSNKSRMIAAPLGLEMNEIESFGESADRDAIRGRLGIPADHTVILCLSVIEPRKCQAVLARAWSLIESEHPDATLVLVGDVDSAYCRRMREYVQAAGMADRVRIEPVSLEPYAWHVAADVFTLVSDVESSPIAVIEAMAFGRPVLATSVWGLPELIMHGETGFLCPPNDTTEIAKALDRLLRMEPEELRQVGARAARHVRERHDADRYAGRLDRLFRGLTRGDAASPAETWADPTSEGRALAVPTN